MLRIVGVKRQKDSNGNVTHVTVIVKEHRKATHVPRKLSPIKKAQFEKDCKEGMTVDEFEQQLQKHIDTLPWKE